MAPGRVNQNLFIEYTESISAPNTGADFCFGHRESFERYESGLVNLESYIPYLVDSPTQVPTGIVGKTSDPEAFINQHVYFTEPRYLQIGTEAVERDRGLIALRRSPYSQIVMRRQDEERLHREKEPTVEPPPIETVQDALKDYFEIDIIAAVTLGLQEVNMDSHDSWRYKYDCTPKEIRALSKRDKVKALNEARQTSLELLSSPRVLPEQIVTSALLRIAKDLKSMPLQTLVKVDLDEKETHYPISTPKKGHLRSVKSFILKNAVGLTSIEDSRLFLQSLQTGVDRVELVA